MNKMVELLEAERPTIPDSNADYDIGYNNGLVMAQAIAIKYDAVLVVRCGECLEYVDGHCCRSMPGGSYVPFPMKPDDFCSHGERKDNG